MFLYVQKYAYVHLNVGQICKNDNCFRRRACVHYLSRRKDVSSLNTNLSSSNSELWLVAATENLNFYFSNYFAEFWTLSVLECARFGHLLVSISFDHEQKLSDFIRLSFNDWSVTAAFPFTNLASLVEPLIPTVNGRFHWGRLNKLSLIIVTSDLNSWY